MLNLKGVINRYFKTIHSTFQMTIINGNTSFHKKNHIGFRADFRMFNFFFWHKFLTFLFNNFSNLLKNMEDMISEHYQLSQFTWFYKKNHIEQPEYFEIL